eukprot:scaffold24105_cov113-Isochrysis_galbana.AAC.8
MRAHCALGSRALCGGGPAHPLPPPSKKLGKIDEHRPPIPLKLATYDEIDRPPKKLGSISSIFLYVLSYCYCYANTLRATYYASAAFELLPSLSSCRRFRRFRP